MEIAIASGKGGVGKSMLASSLAMLFGENKKVLAVDCDIDTPNLHIWLNETKKWKYLKKLALSQRPVISNNQQCDKESIKKCKFGALQIIKGKLKLNPFLCEGCGACEIFCPQAIKKMKIIENGEIRTMNTKYGFPLISGKLFPGETGSGKIVTEVKKEAEKFNYDIQIIDSAPGTDCPVIASLQGADFVVLMTEPTLSAFSDLKKVLEVVTQFNLPWGVVINKWGINREIGKKIKNWAGDKFLGKISYDKKIFESIANLIPILETNLKVKIEIKIIFQNLTKYL